MRVNWDENELRTGSADILRQELRKRKPLLLGPGTRRQLLRGRAGQEGFLVGSGGILCVVNS